MSASERLAFAAAKVAVLTGIKRVRVGDEERSVNVPNGGADREAARLSTIVRRLEKDLS